MSAAVRIDSPHDTQNIPEIENPSLLVPPYTDAGTVPNPLGLHLLVGADNVRTMVGNFARNLQEGRVRIVEGIFERVSMPIVSSSLLNQ